MTGRSENQELSFALLSRFASANYAEAYRQYTPASQLRSVYQQALNHCHTVSFDIFDTAILRYVDHPVDVFLHLGQQPAFAAHNFREPVSGLRIKAESKARAMVHKITSSAEVNLLEIYQVFCDLAGISRQHASALVEAEEQVELKLCSASSVIYELYEEAIARGKQVLFISDSYHTGEFLLTLLRGCGYAVSKSTLIVSSEARKSKQSGELFPAVLSTLGLQASNILHVGDHPISDSTRATEISMAAILHPYKASREQPSLLANGNPKSPADERLYAHLSFVRGMVRATPQIAEAAGRGGDFWWKFGYSSCGPLAVGFCQWLEQGLRKDSIEHAYFMLRDGLLPYRVFQTLYEGEPGTCPASTLPTSRRACLLPILEIAPAFSMVSMLAGIGLRPVREYLERLNIPSAGFEAEARAVGFDSLNQQIDGRIETNRLVDFFLQKRVSEALVDRGRIELVALLGFLKQEKVTSHKRVALVDLGWTGTVHKSLHLLLSQVAPQVELVGYYVATFLESPFSIVPGLDVRSYLAHRGQPQSTIRQILQFLDLFEFVFSSTEGSLLYFNEANSAGVPSRSGVDSSKRFVPVLQSSDRSVAKNEQLEAIHAGAVAFAVDYRKIASALELPSIPPEVAAEEFFRVIHQPTCEEASELGGIEHCDNLGSSSLHTAAKFRSGAAPEDLLRNYRESQWKQGLLAAQSPEGSTLRTLLWLISSRDAQPRTSYQP